METSRSRMRSPIMRRLGLSCEPAVMASSMEEEWSKLFGALMRLARLRVLAMSNTSPLWSYRFLMLAAQMRISSRS